LLTAADEARLARRIQRGDPAAKDELVIANLGLVRALARRYRGSGMPFEDLVQEGSVGLIRAAEKFDHRRGVKFSTYAAWWIRGAMRDAIGRSSLIRVPAGADPELAAVRRAAQPVASLDAPIGEAMTPLGELVADPGAVDPAERAIEHAAQDGVVALLALLPHQHREVLVRHYGVDGFRAESHREIGRSLGVGEERSRQIERDSLHRLRSISATAALAA
jgi:RNA polymerase primary sigma factor